MGQDRRGKPKDVSLDRCTIEPSEKKCPVRWTEVAKRQKPPDPEVCTPTGRRHEGNVVYECKNSYTLMKKGIYLDNDEMGGHGPETVTFHSPPPGKYEVVVHVYNHNQVGAAESFRNAQEALVKVYIGDTIITCAAREAKNALTGKKECASSIWKVFDIRVTHTVDGHLRFTFDDSSRDLESGFAIKIKIRYNDSLGNLKRKHLD